MATLTVRELDEDVKARLRVRAAKHGRSMEAEVRAILTDAVADPSPQFGLGSRLGARAMDLQFVDVDIPDRSETPRAASLDE